MNNYCDEFGRLHHKPVTASNPVPSNNGWLYTAYAHKIGLTLFWEGLKRCFTLCSMTQNSFGQWILIRSPNKSNVPISRDEILGMVQLGLLKPSHLTNWNFSPFPIPKFNLFTLLKQIWELRPSIVEVTDTVEEFDENNQLVYSSTKTYRELKFKHRNYFWQNNLDQLYRFAFSVPLQDRHFMLKTWGIFDWRKPSHLCYALIAKIDSLFGKSGIKFLKYGKPLIESTDAKSKGLLLEMSKEFPEDHPITEAVKNDFSA